MRERLFGGDHEDERLSALLDDELSEADALEVTRHLDRCERCLAELEAIREARVALRALPALTPPARVFAVDGGALGRREATRPATAVILLVALVALLALGFLLGGRAADGSVVPPVDQFVADHVARTGGGPVPIPVDLGPSGR